MLRKFRRGMHREDGFSLLELRVVILVIGMLAALALWVLLGQRLKGQGADAKSNARNLVSHLEAFHATEKTYDADDAKESDDIKESRPPLGHDRGEVDITAGDEHTYTIVAISRAGGTFTVSRDDDGSVVRTCGDPGEGGCAGDGKW